MDINGQAALVTGGASGLGAATAAALQAAGARVTLLDINPAAVEAAAARTGALVWATSTMASVFCNAGSIFAQASSARSASSES